MSMRFFFWVFCITGLMPLHVAFGQSQLQYHGTIVQAEGGVGFLNYGELNTVMEDSGYRAFSNTQWAFGFGLETFKGSWLIGGNIYFLMRQAPGQQQNVIQLAILNHYYGSVKVGYLAFRRETRGLPFMIYPTLGAGVGHAILRTSPSGLAKYNRYPATGFLLDLAVNLAQFAEIRGNDKYSVKIGGSAGYVYNVAGSQSLNTLADGSQIPLSPQGFYLRLTLGMGTLYR